MRKKQIDEALKKADETLEKQDRKRSSRRT